MNILSKGTTKQVKKKCKKYFGHTRHVGFSTNLLGQMAINVISHVEAIRKRTGSKKEKDLAEQDLMSAKDGADHHNISLQP